MAKKTKVRKHIRKIGKKKVKIKGYVRKNRPTGKKAKKYIKVGTLMIAHDKYGNIKSSRVVPLTKKKKRSIRATKRRAKSRESEIEKIKQKFVNQEITFKEWIKKMDKLV